MSAKIHQTEMLIIIAATTVTVTLDVRYIAVPHDNDKGCGIEILSIRAPKAVFKDDSINIDWMLPIEINRAIVSEIEQLDQPLGE